MFYYFLSFRDAFHKNQISNVACDTFLTIPLLLVLEILHQFIYFYFYLSGLRDLSEHTHVITIRISRDGTLSCYNIPQSFMITFFIPWLNNFGVFYLILIGWFIESSVKTFQPLTVIYRRSNFVYHH